MQPPNRLQKPGNLRPYSHLYRPQSLLEHPRPQPEKARQQPHRNPPHGLPQLVPAQSLPHLPQIPPTSSRTLVHWHPHPHLALAYNERKHRSRESATRRSLHLPYLLSNQSRYPSGRSAGPQMTLTPASLSLHRCSLPRAHRAGPLRTRHPVPAR